MEQKSEIVNILKAELTLLSKEILRDIHKKDLKDLYKSTRKLYEKMAAIQQLMRHLETDTISEIINPAEQKPVQENSKPIEDKKIIDKNEIVQPKPELTEKKPENVYKKVSEMKFVAKETAIQKNIPLKKMNIGLNDRISFVKHLFKGDIAGYEETIGKLNEFTSYEEALSYLHNEIKPRYDDWQDAEEYEFRLLQLLELKFN